MQMNVTRLCTVVLPTGSAFIGCARSQFLNSYMYDVSKLQYGHSWRQYTRHYEYSEYSSVFLHTQPWFAPSVIKK